MAGEMDRKRPVENIGVMEDEPPVKIAKLNLATGPENMMTALIASQFYPQKGAEPNRMGVEGSVFKSNLQEYLNNNLLDSFVADCIIFFQEKENLIKAFGCTKLLEAKATTNSSVKKYQMPEESLVLLLLNMEDVQPALLEFLLLRFKDGIEEEKGPQYLPKMILQQITRLGRRIMDAASVIETLVSVFHLCQRDLHKEILDVLLHFSFFDDDHTKLVFKKLGALLLTPNRPYLPWLESEVIAVVWSFLASKPLYRFGVLGVFGIAAATQDPDINQLGEMGDLWPKMMDIMVKIKTDRSEEVKDLVMKEVSDLILAAPKFTGTISSFSNAVRHLSFVSGFLHLPEQQPDINVLVPIAESYLKRKWSIKGIDRDRRPTTKSEMEHCNVGRLILAYLEGKDTLDRLECISKAISEVFQTEEGVSNSFPTCNQLTCGTFLCGAFRSLYKSADNIPDSNQTQLGSWRRIFEILGNLMISVKTKEEVTPNCLTHGKSIVDLFYRKLMPFREEMWKNSENQFQELLWELKNVIDTLNEICTHAQTFSDPPKPLIVEWENFCPSVELPTITMLSNLEKKELPVDGSISGKDVDERFRDMSDPSCFKCKECGLSFRTGKNFLRHCSKEHKYPPPSSS